MMTQEEWDLLLVDAFVNHKDAHMYRLFVHISEVEGLLRVPQVFHLRMTVARFVVELLPDKLADMLWRAKSKDIPVIAKVLSKSKIKAGVQVGRKTKAQNREIHKEARQYRANKIGVALWSKHRKKSEGHDWGTCK